MEVPAAPNPCSVRVVRWPDAVLEGTAGGYAADIHAIYSVGGNFLNQGSEIRKNIAAFNKADFTVCHELFMTPTARYCDVVFPAASPLEKEDIGLPWLGNYLLYKAQAVPPRGQARSDYDIFCSLADQLGFLQEFSEGRSAAQWVGHFMDQSEIPDVEEFRRTGLYLAPDQERVGLAEFSADPQGYPLDTASGKVEIASERYQHETGFPAIPTWQEPPADSRYPLRLITPKSRFYTHSQGSNIPEIREKAAHALVMNPEDAASRKITDGSLVYVFNEQGEAKITARLSDDLIRGVVCLPEGIWFELDEKGVDTAGAANILTSTQGTTPGLAVIMHAVGVEVRADQSRD